MRATLTKLPIRGIKDLIATLAVVRPGPASGEAKAAYIRRATGLEASEPPHPRLADLLRETHGMMLYEEDLMAAIAAMTGWSLERSDDLRSAILNEDQAPEMAWMERQFLEASVRTGVPRDEAASLWQILTRFAAYSFNKAHASSYAQLAWQSVYLKSHYPVEFACAVLNSYGGHYPLRTIAAEFARIGVGLRAPHVNASEINCRVEAEAAVHDTVESHIVRIGLLAVKRLTRATRGLILDECPFRDLSDFLERVAIPYRELEALILCGACDGLSPLVAEDYPFAHERLLNHIREEGIHALDGFVPPRAEGNKIETYRTLVRIRNELQFLAMHVADHPMRVLRDEAAREGCATTAELRARIGEFVRIAALVAATRRLATRGGKVMQFVTFEDECGLVEAVLFPGIYAALGDPVTNPGPFLVSGRVAENQGEVHLVVSDLMPFYRRARPYGRSEAV
jgi:DNA polymerase III alpha subunit